MAPDGLGGRSWRPLSLRLRIFAEFPESMPSKFFLRRLAAPLLVLASAGCATATPTAMQGADNDRAALAAWNERVDAALATRADTLAARGAPRDLIASALLRAMPPRNPETPGIFPDWERPGAREAWQSARDRSPDDVLLAWIELENCPGPCDADAARARLQRLEPDNAAAWLQAFDAAWLAGDERLARAHLARAARSERFSYHFEELGLLLQDATTALPVPAPTPAQLRALDMPAGSSADDVTAGAVFGHAVIVISGLPRLHEACGRPGLEPAAYADCHGTLLHLARSRDLLSRMIGTSQLSRLTAGTPGQAQWQAAWRRLRWLHAQSAGFDSDSADYIRGAWQSGEVAALEALLRANGVPLEPPADWDADAAAPRPVPAS
jgi:hypothetical protein